MLPGMAGAAGKVRSSRENMIDVLGRLGLTTNLKLCLDAGDAASYTSGQKWLDRSGGGYDFYLGANGSAAGDDPTFTGTAGGKSSSEYFAFDGGDCLTYDSASESWMDAMHKDAASVSGAMWIRPDSFNSFVPSRIIDTAAEASGTGIDVAFAAGFGSRQLVVSVYNAASSVFSKTSSATIAADAWAFIGFSINEASNSLLLNCNGTAESYSCTYSSPSTGVASQPITLFDGFDCDASCVALWQGTSLTAANLAAIRAATRTKFGV